MQSISELLITDLIQAKLLKSTDKVGSLKMLFLLLRYRTARIQYFIRLRSSKRSLTRLISKVYLDGFHIEIGANCKIGSHFWLPHPRCIIIADFVVIGDHVHVGQYVTIGGNFKKTKVRENGIIQKVPVLGHRINIHPGAVIGGPVLIGSDVIVGANAVITHDVASNSMVFGQNQVARKRIKIPAEGGSYSELLDA